MLQKLMFDALPEPSLKSGAWRPMGSAPWVFFLILLVQTDPIWFDPFCMLQADVLQEIRLVVAERWLQQNKIIRELLQSLHKRIVLPSCEAEVTLEVEMLICVLKEVQLDDLKERPDTSEEDCCFTKSLQRFAQRLTTCISANNN
eukprot:GHVN01001596.1.p1 GENE.GHVN01001596.1~~GHVN01001596.1.p1  ORF type:complete len:145 (-),score=11.49 GHVN01001596.1:64-498(-)